MVQINLGKLKDRGDDIVSLLEEKLGVSPVLEGGKVLLEDEDNPVRMKDVKTYLKKYLHREGLRKDTRILVEKGEVNFVTVKREEE
ncbi:MAG: hypothetical protein ACE5KU_03230 [Nitrososphaerales archaeon]